MASRVLVAADNGGGRVKFAVLNGLRVAPEKGLIGVVCPICKQPVFARCGEIRLPHWAHKSVIDCDPWKESETQWHRNWKRSPLSTVRLMPQDAVRYIVRQGAVRRNSIGLKGGLETSMEEMCCLTFRKITS